MAWIKNINHWDVFKSFVMIEATDKNDKQSELPVSWSRMRRWRALRSTICYFRLIIQLRFVEYK